MRNLVRSPLFIPLRPELFRAAPEECRPLPLLSFASLLDIPRRENFFTRLFSAVSILRAVGIGGESHPRDFGAPLYDRLPDDHPRDAAAHGENTVDK